MKATAEFPTAIAAFRIFRNQAMAIPALDTIVPNDTTYLRIKH